MHNHEHHHEHGKPTAQQLLKFMQSHNEEHANELSLLADKIASEGHDAQAELIREGLESIRSGNAKVAEALSSLQE